MCLFNLFIQSALIDPSLCSGHGSRCFMHIHSFNLYNDPLSKLA